MDSVTHTEPADRTSLAGMMRSLSENFPKLRLLKRTFKPSGVLFNEEFWLALKLSNSSMSAIQTATIYMEQQYGRGSWEDLEGWIANVQKQMHDRLNLLSKFINTDAPDAGKALKHLYEGLVSSQGKRELGPNWKYSLKELHTMWGLPVGKPLIPSLKLLGSLERKASAIESIWKCLRKIDQSAALSRFRTS